MRTACCHLAVNRWNNLKLYKRGPWKTAWMGEDRYFSPCIYPRDNQHLEACKKKKKNQASTAAEKAVRNKHTINLVEHNWTGRLVILPFRLYYSVNYICTNECSRTCTHEAEERGGWGCFSIFWVTFSVSIFLLRLRSVSYNMKKKRYCDLGRPM